MANEKSVEANRKSRKENIPRSWNSEQSRAEEVQGLIGVGRAGAPIRSLDIPGVSSKSEAQLKDLGIARMRITKPGSDHKPKPIK